MKPFAALIAMFAVAVHAHASIIDFSAAPLGRVSVRHQPFFGTDEGRIDGVREVVPGAWKNAAFLLYVTLPEDGPARFTDTSLFELTAENDDPILSLRLEPTGAIALRLYGADGSVHTTTAAVPGATLDDLRGQPMLVVVSMFGRNNQPMLLLRTRAGSADAVGSDGVPTPQIPFRITLGASLDGTPAAPAVLGPLVVRRHVCTAYDATDLYELLDPGALVELRHTALDIESGGTMSGRDGFAWGLIRFPQSAADGDQPTENTLSISDFNDNFDVRPGPLHVTINDAEHLAFRLGSSLGFHFAADPRLLPTSSPLPGGASVDIDGDPTIAGPPPTFTIRQLGEQAPRGLHRVGIWSNSRAVRGTADLVTTYTVRPGEPDYNQLSAQNYASGASLYFDDPNHFAESRLAGVLNRECSIFGVVSEVLDQPAAPDRANVDSFDGRSNRFYHDITRLNAKSTTSIDSGIGSAYVVMPGGYFDMWANLNGTINAVSPLTLRALAVAFPGSGSITARPIAAYPQPNGRPPQVFQPYAYTGPIEQSIIDLDTTVCTGTVLQYIPGSATNQGRGAQITLEFSTPPDREPEAGDFITVAKPNGDFGIGLITSSTPTAPNQRTLTLEFSIGRNPASSNSTNLARPQPEPGDIARIGPWDFRWIGVEHTDPIADPADGVTTLTYRGVRYGAAANPDALGTIVLAPEAFRPDASGFVFGTFGRGGLGYANQIKTWFSTPRASDGLSPFQGLLRALDLDAIIIAPAQQNSDPDSIEPIVNLVRTADPKIELAFAAECVHADYAEFNAGLAGMTWNRWMLDNADRLGIPTVSAFTSLSHTVTQAAMGLRPDSSHLTSLGNKLLWERGWGPLFADAASVWCSPADLALPAGMLNFADIQVFLGAFAAADPQADLAAPTGTFNFADVQVFLGAFNTGCP